LKAISNFFAPVNITSKQGVLDLAMTGATTYHVMHVIGGPSLRAHLFNNTFRDYMLFSTVNMEYLKAAFNQFVAHERARNPRNQLSAGNLIILATCQADLEIYRNRFWNGTMFLVMDSSNHVCKSPDNPSGKLIITSEIHYNVFPNRKRIYKISDALAEPAVPALGFYAIENLLPLDTTFSGTILNATRNYWGSPSGPYICCHPEGDGAYTTNQIDVSDWCLSESCLNSNWTARETSGIFLDHLCLVDGCMQRFNTVDKVLFFLAFGVGIILSLTGLILVILRARRAHALKGLPRADLVEMAFKYLLIGLLFSSLVGICVVVNVTPLIHSTLVTPRHAHQERIPFRGWVILSGFFFVGCLQIAFNGLTALAIWKRKVHPSIVSYSITALLIWNMIVICMAFTLSLWWIPSSGFADLLEPFFLTHPSSLTWLIYCSSALVILMSIIAIVPIHMVSTLVYHYEYSTLNSSIDQELLSILRHDPTLERQSSRLRQWLAITFLSGTFSAMLTAFDIVRDPFVFLRYVIVLIQTVLGLISLIAAAILSLQYYRTNLLLVIIVLILMSVLGTVQDIWFWVVYLSIGDSRFIFTLLHLISTILWGITLSISVAFVYRLRESVLTILPAAIAANLNYHLDQSWSIDPFRSSDPDPQLKTRLLRMLEGDTDEDSTPSPTTQDLQEDAHVQ
jgi:hypothetical protein